MITEFAGSLDTMLPYAASLFTGIGLILYYLRKGDAEKMKQLREDIAQLRKDMDEQNERHAQEVASMNQRSSFLDGVIATLQRELIEARLYIAMLRGILADKGIPTPEPDVYQPPGGNTP
ncbi:hypothetical protein CJ179_38290 [Rhodococcus sp. ACS1]|uniref:hypothetical protein n=1 Tax=Rhodococcus sp. ACS1 TaxID=2028570 RepID=UPI000BB1592C|nr:hypothetical protein [Rhodococcus sp. ACS1]PBC38458.1 hypothetical protein CJ179_38290 [Rhodococcus sp. ACS1]